MDVLAATVGDVLDSERAKGQTASVRATRMLSSFHGGRCDEQGVVLGRLPSLFGRCCGSILE